jgi:hypothetical protein
MVIWVVVNYSMTATKIVQNIPIRVTHLPPGKTINGMQTSGLLHDRVTLSISGNKTALEEISEKDLEVVLDASGKPNEWTALIGKKEIVSLNPDFNPAKAITKVGTVEKIIRHSKLVTEKIPIMVTQPIGEAPKGYQYLDVFPPQLELAVSGPEETVKRLKSRGGLKLTFNLADISKAELDTLQQSGRQGASDEISYFVHNSWKKIAVPTLSETPFEINDPQAKNLRIVFSRQDLLPITTPIPVTIFFPNKYSGTLNPETYKLATNDFIVKKNGSSLITAPLCAQGVSSRFLDLVKDRIQVVIVAAPKSEREHLIWNVQLVYPRELEDHFVAKMISESGDEVNDIQPSLREDFLRNRFRSYMDRFRLYTPNNKKLQLKISLDANTINASPVNYP